MAEISLTCPETRRRLTEAVGSREMCLVARRRQGPQPIGMTPSVMLRDDRLAAYPIVGGIPVVLVPEMLGPEAAAWNGNLSEERYAEAYEEMRYYNAVGAMRTADVASSAPGRAVGRLLRLPSGSRDSWPYPRDAWIDASVDGCSQRDAFEYLGDTARGRVLQLGGSGLQIVKLLVGGAREGWLVSPMLNELVFAQALASFAGVAERLNVVAAIGEELPFPDGEFDAVYCGGCLHHMVVDLALSEVRRVLRAGGRFVAIEPWRAPLYGVGTKVFGKREPDVHCRPLTGLRMQCFHHLFPRGRIIHHGALTRYPLIALGKLGVHLPRRVTFGIISLDDRVASSHPELRRMGSSVAILGEREGSRSLGAMT